MRSLEFGRVLQGNAKGIAVHHDGPGLFQLFDAPSFLNQAEQSCQSALGPLLTADRGGVLITPLRTYRGCGRNLRRTAEALRIHYNTASCLAPPVAPTFPFSSTPLDLAKPAQKGGRALCGLCHFPSLSRPR